MAWADSALDEACCLSDTKAYRRECSRRWRAANPEKKRAESKAYYEKNKLAQNLRTKAWYDRNKLKHRQMMARWAKLNPESIAKTRAKRVATGKRILEHKTYYAANKEKIIARTNEWRKNNPDKRRASKRRQLLTGKIAEHDHRRRARMNNNPSEDCSEKIKLIRVMAICQYCFSLIEGRPTVDHKIPIARGGGHVTSNLIAACSSCNYSKGDKLLSEWTGRKAA